jgi:uncharacterized protein (DUF2141 family)
MHTVIAYLTLFLTALSMQSQNTIDVWITGFSSNNGIAMVGLYNSEENFLEKMLLGKQSEIANGAAKVVFSDIPEGVYAIGVFHDEDDNGKLNMVMGLYPSEDVGASNNAPARFGPPKWEDAKFEIKDKEHMVQKIILN